MFGYLLKRAPLLFGMRKLSLSAQNNFKVTVVGAGGGIGQPLSLLLKMNPLVTNLSLYDIARTPGVAVDLSHIDTLPVVEGIMCPENLAQAIVCADIVVVTAGISRKPGMSRDDLFNSNATVIAEVAEVIAKVAPKALIAIITNPVNSMVPLAAEVLKKNNAYDPKRLFGVTTLDVVRARTFIARFEKRDPQKYKIFVIGGHSGPTILPIISCCQPPFSGEDEDIEKLTKRIQNAGTEVVDAKAGEGSATLSMAYAGALFTNSLLRALSGAKNVIECSYVESDVVSNTQFFSTPLKLGDEGIKENMGLPRLSCYESELLEAMLPELQKNIKSGIDFAAKHK